MSCPCNGYHWWGTKEGILVDECQNCDCCAWCTTCDGLRPPFNLVHQCHFDRPEDFINE